MSSRAGAEIAIGPVLSLPAFFVSAPYCCSGAVPGCYSGVICCIRACMI